MIRKGTIASLSLAALATLALAVTSYWTPFKWWRRVPTDHGLHVLLWQGRVAVSRWHVVEDALAMSQQTHQLWGLVYSAATWPNVAFFDYTDKMSISWSAVPGDPARRPSGPSVEFAECRFPVWWLPFLLAVYPFIAVIAFNRGPLRRWRRRRKGLCLKCGYDLTGNVSGRCPECGEAV